MNNNWQLKTTPIASKAEDTLCHNSVAELLDEKIDYLFSQKDIPSCICLNGEYGSGKSTIINLLFEKWQNSTNKKVVHFNIWRHKDANTYYALFRNIFYALKNKKGNDFRNHNFIESLTDEDEITGLDCDFSDTVYSSFSRKRIDQKDLDKGIEGFVNNIASYITLLTWGVVKIICIFSFILTVFIVAFKYGFSSDFSLSLSSSFKVLYGVLFSSTIFILFFKNIFGVIPTLFKFHVQPAETTVTLPEISNTEQLQCIFRNMLNTHSREKGVYENTNFVIVIEDVDRKNHDEIIKTLNDLRTFIDLGKAIFIIPCDINNIERAFLESAIETTKYSDEEYSKWKAKDFCSKIFSHTISIPPQSKLDLRNFLINKIKSELPNTSIKGYLKGREKLESLIDILLTDSVKTPRESINVFNRFTLQFEHALKLEDYGGKLKKGTVSNHILEYARVYVLSVYYGLEKHLLDYPELPHWILDIFRNREYANQFEELDLNKSNCFKNDVPSYALKNIKKIYKFKIITPEIEEFISRTEHYNTLFLKAFIYLDEISYSGSIGSKIYGEIYTSLKARNIKKIEGLLNNDPREISEAICKITDNLKYSSDYRTILPSLVSCFDSLDDNFKTKIADYILEHYDRIGDIYLFPSKSMCEIFDKAINSYSIRCKKKYFTLFSNYKKITSDKYYFFDKAFELAVTLIEHLNSDLDYVDDDVKGYMKEFVNSVYSESIAYILDKNETIPVNPEAKAIEFKQRDRYIELLANMNEATIIEIFSGSFLDRLTNDIRYYFTETSDIVLLKKSFNKLVSIYLKTDKDSTIQNIKSLSGYVLVDMDKWYLDLVKEHKEYFKDKFILLDLLEKIYINIIVEYLREDLYQDNTEIIEQAILLFAELDGYAFKTLNNNYTKVFNGLLEFYKIIIKTHKSKDFLEFVLKCINDHENTAKYNFSFLLTESIIEYLGENLWKGNIESDEYINCKLIGEFLVQNNRIIKLEKEQLNLYRDKLLNQFQIFINNNQANTEQSECIYQFIKQLNYTPGFNLILVTWLEELNIVIGSKGTPFTYYRDYLKLIDLVKEELSYEYLNKFLDKCSYLITNCSMNYDDSLLVWQWINNISEFNNNLSIIKDSIISFVISNYANRESYFKEEIKRIVVNVMYRYKIFEDDNSRDIYNNYLLWASDDYLELISYYSDSIDLFDSEQFHICLRIIRENDKWSTINKTIAKNKAYYEDCLIHEIFKKEDIEYIYLNTKLILDWTKIITEVVRNVAIKENREIAIKLNALNKDILAHVDELKIKKEVSPFLQNLLADAVDMKLLALDLIDKYRYPINDKSDMFFSIKSDFVDICDVNTGIKNLEKLKRWLKSHRLTPKSGINERLKIIMKTANSSLKTDLQALIKY